MPRFSAEGAAQLHPVDPNPGQSPEHVVWLSALHEEDLHHPLVISHGHPLLGLAARAGEQPSD